MKTIQSLNIKKSYKYSAASYFLMLLVALYAFNPFTAIASMYGMVGDTAIQIKTGLDGIASGHLMLDEVYSWHPNLIWTAHEEGWYFLLGFMYKIMGLMGIVLAGSIFNLSTAFIGVRYMRDKAHPLINALVIVMVPFLGGFPDYNVRPSATSAFAVMLLVVVMLKDGLSTKAKVITFVLLSYMLAWTHGGILPIFFMVMAVMAVVELIYKNFRKAICYGASIVGAFAVTLINPIGIRIWTFGLKQMGATDIWANVDEWQPHKFSLFEALAVLLVLIGFMCSEKVMKFDKEKITKLALLSMFFVATCIYTRFILYFSLVFMLFAPRAIEDLLIWINKNVFKFNVEKVSISDTSYAILIVACAALTLYLGSTNVMKYIHTNSMRDIEEMAAFDPEAVEYIKSQNYEKVYNNFNSGSWLAFYDVKVHIDNRIDPYMKEYSGVDHIRGKMGISNLYELDRFRAEYNPDAYLIDMGTGESKLLYEIETYASDRYRIVYDNTCTSNLTDSLKIRWVIIEPV